MRAPSVGGAARHGRGGALPAAAKRCLAIASTLICISTQCASPCSGTEVTRGERCSSSLRRPFLRPRSRGAECPRRQGAERQMSQPVSPCVAMRASLRSLYGALCHSADGGPRSCFANFTYAMARHDCSLQCACMLACARLTAVGWAQHRFRPAPHGAACRVKVQQYKRAGCVAPASLVCVFTGCWRP